jgi:membrane protease YdiL (CAAX protease family)
MIISGLMMLIGVYLFERERLFDLPKGNILVWGLLCTFYPFFSAYGQEIIYRTFLFRRYTSLFKKEWMVILASGISFSFVHIIYYSPVSILLTLIGGLYFAYQYSRTRSVLFTAILHGIMGIIVFTVGLGEYFWLDMSEWIKS